MPKVRKEISELEKLVQVGRKKLSVMRKGYNYILWGCIHFRNWRKMQKRSIM